MDGFFENLPLEDAEEIESLARVVYELRENRASLLNRYGVSDEGELLDRVAAGDLPEHPAYEHYLSARILEETRSAVRDTLAQLLREVKPS